MKAAEPVQTIEFVPSHRVINAEPEPASVLIPPKNWAQAVSVEDLFRFLLKLLAASLLLSAAAGAAVLIVALIVAALR